MIEAHKYVVIRIYSNAVINNFVAQQSKEALQEVQDLET